RPWRRHRDAAAAVRNSRIPGTCRRAGAVSSAPKTTGCARGSATSGTWHRGSSSWSGSLVEPMELKTGAQGQACAMKDDVDIGDRQAKLGADFLRLQLDNLTHHENAALLGRQPVEARIEDRKKL